MFLTRLKITTEEGVRFGVDFMGNSLFKGRGGPLGIDLGSWVEHRDEHPEKLGQGDGSNRRHHVVPSESFDGVGQPIVQQTELVRQKASDLVERAMGALQPIR